MDSISKSKSKAGFTLAEILLAMMVFAIAISTILALLARSIETADSILVKDEAIGLSSAVDSFMNEQAFATVYEDVLSGKGLFAYHYRANPGSPRADGTLTSYPTVQATDQLGVNYVVVSGVRADEPATELDEDYFMSNCRFRMQILLAHPCPQIRTRWSAACRLTTRRCWLFLRSFS
jgi:Tfp pilus assembly protein PilV